MTMTDDFERLAAGIVAVWEDEGNSTYVHWRYVNGEEMSGYNLMYETKHGLRTLKRILEEKLNG